MALKKTKFIKGIILAPDNASLDGVEGELKVDSTDGKIKATLSSVAREIVTNSQTQELTNKTVTTPVINGTVSGTAIESDLSVSAAANKLAYAGAIKTYVNSYVDDKVALKDEASEIVVSPVIGDAPNNNTVQKVLETHETRLDTIDSTGLKTDLSNWSSSATFPSGVSSLTSSRSGSNTFTVKTVNQTSTASSPVQFFSGDSTVSSGIVNIGSGFNSAASTASALDAATGVLNIRSGFITGGTQGSTGDVNVKSGDISSSSITGISGNVLLRSGDNQGANGAVGSGSARLQTGNARGSSGSSGQVVISTGKSANAHSGNVQIFTGNIATTGEINNNTNTSGTGPVTLNSGDIFNTVNTSFSGALSGRTGNHAGLGQSGFITFDTGNVTNPSSAAPSGFMRIATGTHAGTGISGEMLINTGNNSGTGSSGRIELRTGTVTTGTRGEVTIFASQLNMNSAKIVNVTTPTAANDAANKAYVDAVQTNIIVSQTSFTVENNQTSPADITGLTFSPTLFRSVKIEYSIYRQTDTAGSARAQAGQLRFVYNTQSSTWLMSDDFAGQSAGVEFSITAAGQIQYTSSNITGTNYVGTLKHSIIKTFGV